MTFIHFPSCYPFFSSFRGFLITIFFVVLLRPLVSHRLRVRGAYMHTREKGGSAGRIKETGGLDVFIRARARSWSVSRVRVYGIRASVKPRLARSFIPSSADLPMNRRYLKDECNGSRESVGPSSWYFQPDILYSGFSDKLQMN